MRSTPMALDQIWKQQLSLVTYGNEYLSHDLPFSRWLHHSIFQQHIFSFRNLHTQHLLAQHFQIWLEGLKKRGVYRLSLHSSNLLIDEKNPNANVELLPFAHFIVSHEHQKKTAWIFGKELAEWYIAENDFEAPAGQRLDMRHETFWSYELPGRLSKLVDIDLQDANWDEIHQFIEQELFRTQFAQGYVEPANRHLPYYGVSEPASQVASDSISLQYLALIPTDYSADIAHELLHRVTALSEFVEYKRKHPFDEQGTTLTPEEQINLRHFSQKIDDLLSKLIVKVANHYKSAQLTYVESVATPLDSPAVTLAQPVRKEKVPAGTHKAGMGNVIKLLLLTIVICVVAYYFGL